MDNPEATPEPQPAAEPTVPPEPVDPYKDRKYIGRHFGFEFELGSGSYFVQGSFFKVGNDRLDIEGIFGIVPYYTTDELVALMAFTPEQIQLFTTKVSNYLKS